MCIEAVNEILNGNYNNAYVLSRPPGHHSGAAKIVEGFCIFNNVSIVANYLIKEKGFTVS